MTTYQEVFFDTSSLSSFSGKEGEEFTLPLIYKGSDPQGTGGISIKVYYDSTLITPLAVEDQLTASAISRNTFGKNLADETNEDSDGNTDKL